ncbi:MAG: hypothetical protein RJA46_1467, partial [Pseudomonadota bacterium]
MLITALAKLLAEWKKLECSTARGPEVLGQAWI